MKARVKEDGRLNVVTAFGGREYTKREWRPVPEGSEEAAGKHPLLEVQEQPVLSEKVSVVENEPKTADDEAAGDNAAEEVADESGRTDLQRGGGRRSRSRNS